MLNVKNILFPTDFSECAEHAFAQAVHLAESYEAVLHVLNVVAAFLIGLAGRPRMFYLLQIRHRVIRIFGMRHDDVEYVEHIALNPDSASFDVSVTGTWDLRTSVSLFTGEPSIVMTVTPDRVTYGPTSTRADHWKSLGPMNMLDISYVDKDLRIMRGNTSVDTIFVWRRK